MRVELEQVRKRFGRTEALRGVSLSVPAGRRVALIGPNGSGKSTLLRSLLGLVACEGKVLLDGRAPFEDRVEVARRLAYVPQVAPQLAAPVGDVLALVGMTRGLTHEALASVAARLELDVAAVRARPFRALSGGMKQKLLIALALASRASLLVMDEPTASLDARARERFFQLCEEVAPGTTLVLCSHRLEELRHLADHVVALEEGRVAYDGPAAEFLAGHGLRDLLVRDLETVEVPRGECG
jgi:ABC-2 type transport system ATP-binding protein